MEKTINSQTQPDSKNATPKPLRVLFADDSENDVLILLHALRKGGYQPLYERAWSAPMLQAALQKQAWDIVISDYEMPGFGGFEALEVVKASGIDVPFILVSAVVSEETAVMAMKAGAQDFLMKSKLARLAPAIERELREAQTRSAKKTTEAALRQSEDQLRQAQKMDAVARLAAGVAHDFNNIITAISGYSSLIIERLESSDPMRKNAEQIEMCATMAAALTHQLLTFSRKEAVESSVLKLNDVIGNVEKMLKRLIGEDIDFRAILDPAVGHIKAAPGQIEQVVMNLTLNARDAMPKGGKVLVSTANLTLDENGARERSGLSPGKYVLLAVEDTGTGMTEEVKAHIFEPFFTTKPRGKGTGLGLATCFGIVKQSSGHIEVETQLGKGSTFKIYFPQVPDPDEPIAIGNGKAKVAGGKETVLLVEDEIFVRQLAATVLRERGYTVIEAANGAEGLFFAPQHQGKIDLVLTDVVMPVMNGKEMADALRKTHPDTKVLFTSGYSAEVIGHHGVLEPGIEFLQKPFQGSALARRVREVLDR